MPDLVVSGINKGWNLGDDITYSGTVSGALEGALLGPPGIAVSLKRTPTYDFGPSAAAAAKVAAAVLEHGVPPRTFVNINVPAGTPKGMRVTTQAKRNHVTKIDARTDPRGDAYYWIEEALDEYHPDSGRSDYEAVKAGYVSVTPLQPDMTAYEVLEQLVAHLQVASLALRALVRVTVWTAQPARERRSRGSSRRRGSICPPRSTRAIRRRGRSSTASRACS